MWKKTAKWSLLALLAIYVAAMFVWSRAEAARHRCVDVEVEILGQNRIGSISEESVRLELEKYPKPLKGAPVNTINTFDVAEFLRKYNNFESVECLITSQSKLKVKVVPMIPEIRVFDGDKSYYVNKDGKIMSSHARFFMDVPVVSGRFNKNFTPKEVLPVVRFIAKDKTLGELTSMIVAKDRNNILLVPRIKGHVINLGDTTRLPEKRQAILTAYRKILPAKGWETYDTISVKFKGQIVATRRDKTPLYPVVEFVEDVDGEEASLAGVGDIGAAPGAPAPVKKAVENPEQKPAVAGDNTKKTEKKKQG